MQLAKLQFSPSGGEKIKKVFEQKERMRGQRERKRERIREKESERDKKKERMRENRREYLNECLCFG